MVEGQEEHDHWMSQVRRGLLELCILNLLERDTMYGYQIVKHLTTVPGLVVSEGTIYPLLSRLKRQGYLTSQLVESPQGPARRNYVLTKAGRDYMRQLNVAWKEVVQAVDGIMQ